MPYCRGRRLFMPRARTGSFHWVHRIPATAGRWIALWALWALLSGFDFGFGGGMRLKGPLWLEATASVGGLRGLTIIDGELSGPRIDVSSSPFVNISLTFRPSFAD